MRSDRARSLSGKTVRTACAAVVCGALLTGFVQHAGAASSGSAAAHAAAFADPPTGSSAVVNLGASNGWKVLTSATATQAGGTISKPGFSTSGWLTVANDGGGAPGTEISALLQNGSCPNVFFSTNMKSCFGQITKIGADTIAQFDVPWWYRTDFTAPPSGQAAKLILNGVVGKADVWVNGTEVAAASTVTGDYSQNVFDVTSLLTSGTNSLAIEV
ncbi:MAG: glycosyl hydrolase 2 galactose-binding domain-containing protein, partial [Sciscionella sp.]